MTLTKLSWAAGVAAAAVVLTGAGVTTWAVAQTKAPTTSRTKSPPAGLPSATPRADPAPLTPPIDPGAGPPDLTPPIALPTAEPARPPILPPTPTTTEMIPPTQPAARPVRTYTLTHPSGTWTREFAGGTKLAVRFDDDRLVIEATLTNVPPPPHSVPPAPGTKDSSTGTLLIDADYAMNKEGVVFGVITGIEHDLPAHALAGIERYIGEPFAFRLRQDDQAMSAKDLKLGGAVRGQPDTATAILQALLVGRYYPAGKDVAGPGVRKQLAKPRLAIAPQGGMMPSMSIPATPYQSIPDTIPAAGPEVSEPRTIDRVPAPIQPGVTPTLPPQPAPTRPAPKRSNPVPDVPNETVPN